MHFLCIGVVGSKLAQPLINRKKWSNYEYLWNRVVSCTEAIPYGSLFFCFLFGLLIPHLYTLYQPAIFWVFAISFHDWKKCSDKCSSPSEHFCMTKMFKHFSEHFSPFSWVYLIPTYVSQLPPPLQRNPLLNMDSSPYSSTTSPSLEGCSPSALIAKESILSCFSSDGLFDSGRFMLYAVARSSCAWRSILMAMKNSPGHGGSTATQAEDWVTPVKTRAKKCILACKGTEDGPLEVIIIRSAKQDDIYGASNILLPCPGS